MVDPLLCSQERPVRAPHTALEGEGVDERGHEWIGVPVGEAREAERARELDHSAAFATQVEHCAKARLVQAATGIGSTAVIDHERQDRAAQHWQRVKNRLAFVVHLREPAQPARC